MLEQATTAPPLQHPLPPEEPSAGHSGLLVWGAVAAITVVAGALRLIDLGGSPLNPFYDAAVRSMSRSWHNFFLGALEPGASVSIDKPPVDLWLQVASVRALGFSTTSLLLPEALFGTAAVPLLFRRCGVSGASPRASPPRLVLALLPIEVITSRSDTMDGVMMALTVLALLCVAQAVQAGSSAWLLAGAAALGVAFDVKLTESLVALPGLGLFAAMALPGSRRRRAGQLLACGAVYVVVALAWLLATLAVPAHERPFAVGSSNGSAWNAALVFNGIDRLEGKPTPGQATSTADPPGTPPPSQYGHLTQTQREERIPIRPPSAGRLLDRAGPLSGDKLGLLVVAALLLGLAALACELLERRRSGRPAGRASPTGPRTRLWGLAGADSVAGAGNGPVQPDGAPAPALHREHHAGGGRHAGDRARLGLRPSQPRAAGRARGVPARPGDLPRAAAVRDPTRVVGGDRLCPGGARGRRLAAPRARSWTLVLALASLLAVPAWASVRAIQHHTTDTNRLGVLPPRQLAALSAYLRSHQGSARYEAAYDEATSSGRWSFATSARWWCSTRSTRRW